MRQRIFTATLVTMLGFALSGCVTTIEGGGTEVDPKRALDNHIQLGLGYLRIRNRESARHHFNKALEYDSRSPGAHDGLALLYQMDGELERAEEHFKKAIRYDRDFSRAHNNYGNFLYQQERYEEAFEHFEVATENLDYDRRPVALVNLGRTALKLGKEERAEAAFRHALNLNRNQTDAIAELAEITFEQQEYAEAKELIDRYGRVSKHSPRTLWLGIRLERIFGNQDKAASYGMQLENMHPYSEEYLKYKQMRDDQ